MVVYNESWLTTSTGWPPSNSRDGSSTVQRKMFPTTPDTTFCYARILEGRSLIMLTGTK